jgi:hypothetical protein
MPAIAAATTATDPATVTVTCIFLLLRDLRRHADRFRLDTKKTSGVRRDAPVIKVATNEDHEVVITERLMTLSA